jgi:hypothetical protein
MKMLKLAFAALTAASIASSAYAAPPKPRPIGVEAQIPFADHRGIRDFQADGRNALWIQDQNRDWYHATVFGPCFGLEYAIGIGFVTRGTSTLDKFGQIVVDGQTCQMETFVTSDPPPKKTRKKRKES